MSNTTFANQLEINLNDSIQTTSNKNAVFDRLIYSNVFEGNIKVGSDGKPLSLGKQFYETDLEGNFVTNADGSYIIRNGLEAGISSIDLNAKTVNQSVAGGILRKTSTATNTDGTTTAVGAMDFAENKFYSKFEEVLQLSQDLQNSINVAGQGALRSSKVFLLEICKYFANLDLAGSSGSNPEKNG
ncbi:hypothetical protein [Francisella tularensis]|uniref:hypothetical protein n=1 Tax=Francisella tularensis TaxID=263 RepID=UPI001F29140B|nr:hypothetical protein [Francisella tularensis]